MKFFSMLSNFYFSESRQPESGHKHGLIPSCTNPVYALIFSANQKIRHVHKLYPIHISPCQVIQCHHVLRVMVLDFQKISQLPIRILRKIPADLYIDSLIPSNRHKINLLRLIFPDINLIASSFQLKVHKVFQHGSNGLGVKAHHTIL